VRGLIPFGLILALIVGWIGVVIRHNLPWTLVLLAYLLIALFYRGVLPSAMQP